MTNLREDDPTVAGMRHILILVENFSVPRDRRVWQESLALSQAGFQVTVICPKGTERDTESETVIDGIRIVRFPLRAATAGPVGYLREYTLAIMHMMRLALKVRREGHIHAVHACNPPDLLFLIAMVLRPGGTKFVFDHHDLGPELFMSRFPRGGRVLHRVTLILERLTFACADAVISTNDTYRQIALDRGKVPADRVVVVRNGPDVNRFVVRDPDPTLKRGKRHLLAYVGVMGHADGIDYALRAIHVLRDELGFHDFHCILMGSGDGFDDLVALSRQLGIADVVEFPGWCDTEFIRRCLSTADVCLAPDPINAFNDASTMIKVAEYMAMGRPIVSFDLRETRVTAGDAAVYVGANDERAFAGAVLDLLEDPARRTRMGALGRRRVQEHLSWNVASRALVDFYQRVTEVRTTDADLR